MASVTKPSNSASNVSDEDEADSTSGALAAGGEGPGGTDLVASSAGAAPGGRGTVAVAQPAGDGFFHIYKKGQGYWTRMGTAITVAVIGAFTSYRLYYFLPTLLPESMTEAARTYTALGVSLGFLLVFSLFAYWITNKPGNVDFLIATDSEMKKVNWTSKTDLYGSTRVVIFFMFAVTIFLFVMDLIFGELFYLIHVLINSPFGGNS